jgi:hypothetical protein
MARIVGAHRGEKKVRSLRKGLQTTGQATVTRNDGLEQLRASGDACGSFLLSRRSYSQGKQCCGSGE